MKYLRSLYNHDDYTAFIVSEDFDQIQAEKKDVVSYCRTEEHIHYNHYIPETRVVAKYNVTDTSSPTTLRTIYEQNIFKSMEIDDVMLDELVTEYTFDTTGEHTVKYELYNETQLGNNAPVFNSSNLVECIIPDSITTIGKRVFMNCSSLTNIDIPDSVTSIDDSAFQNCDSLTSIDIPDSVTSIGIYSFNNCDGLTSINIPNSVTNIGSSAFESCDSLTSVTIGNGVTIIGNYAFKDCINLANITMQDSVTRIGDYAFNNCSSLTSITIPDSVTSIGNNAFTGCSGLTSIDIPDSVTTISYNAFNSCSGLTNITIGNGVTSIWEQAFKDCSNLTSIVSNAMTAPSIRASTFSNVKTGGTLTVPSGSTGYDTWMSTDDYYLGSYSWTKVEQ